MEAKARHKSAQAATGALRAADIRDRFALRSAGLNRRGDHDLNPGMEPKGVLTPASVLLPIVDRGPELSLLFTKRTDTLSSHAGQVSFPGGRQDPEDADAVATACRETFEEIGVPGEDSEVFGQLDDYITRTGYHITPVVGLMRPPPAFDPNPAEVEAIFEVPLSYAADRSNIRRESLEWKSGPRGRGYFYALTYDDWYIWGATAGMLKNLVDILDPDT